MHHLANALVDLGHEVLVLAKRVSLSDRRASRESTIFAAMVCRCAAAGEPGLTSRGGWLELGRARRLRGIEVVSCHGVDHAGTIARYGKQLFGFPLVMTPHGLDVQRVPEIGYGMRLDPAWDRVITRNLRAADCVTAISRSVRQELDMVDPGRVVDLPNGIHVARFAGPHSEYLRRELAIAPNQKDRAFGRKKSRQEGL